jgi:hypothetical protein
MTTTLFIAESTANRISKVTACGQTPTVFATGITNPLGLDISPGNGWGPADPANFNLYVANGSNVSRIDQNGTVTPFSTGYNSAEYVHFGANGQSDYAGNLPINQWGTNVRLRVSDSGAGTIEDISIQTPFFQSLTLTGCGQAGASCHAGDVFSVSAIIANIAPIAVHVEIKGGFELPDGTKFPFTYQSAPVFGNKFFETDLAQGLNLNLPWVSVTLPALTPGRYCYRAQMNDAELNTVSTPRIACFYFN